VAVGAFYFLRTERARVESATLGRSEILTMLVDGRLRRDLAAIGVLSSSVHLAQGQLPEFYERMQRVLATNPAWHTVALLDARTEQEILDLRRPFGAPVQLTPTHAEGLQRASRPSKPALARPPRTLSAKPCNATFAASIPAPHTKA
jgi:hypothetical protein